MKPIAQTFIVNEPETGIDVVFVTKVDLFFRTKSPIYGVELQIRETENGVPTRKTLPYATKILQTEDVNVSTDGTAATTFSFNTPIVLRTNEQFALVVVPIAGNPDYNIWVAELGGTDAATNAPIFNNNQLGSLFVSSNDLNFTPIQSESMKYKLYTAQFTSSSAVAVFKNVESDIFNVYDVIGDFSPKEQVVMSNNYLQLSSLTISGSNTYDIGERVFQPAGSSTANITQATAYGTVYFANTTKVLMNTTYGAFNTSDSIRGAISNYVSAAPSFANQSTVTTSACNVVYVPDANSSITTDYTPNNFIYIGKNTGANVQVLQISSVNVVTRTLTLASNVNFTDSAAIIGRVKADAQLRGTFTSITPGGSEKALSLSAINSDSVNNFANSTDYMLIGRSSGATAKIGALVDLKYESITSLFPAMDPNQTYINFSFKGTKADTSRTSDTVSYSIVNEIPYEFIDKTRVVMSRSNEIKNPPTAGISNSSLIVTATLESANSKLSPYIDTIRNSVATTHNIVTNIEALQGALVSYDSSNGFFYPGDRVSQANTITTVTGTVISGNGSILYINTETSSNTKSIGRISISNTYLYNIDRGYTAELNAVRRYSEVSNTNISCTRYISKNVILADQQDAEDLVCYISAYRPAGADFKVYGRFLAGADGDSLNNKDWSAMVEVTDPSLVSSVANRDDLVELVYDLPESELVITNNATTGVALNINANTAGVNNVAETLLITDANTYLTVGDKVYYNVPTGNTAIPNLTGNSYYYVTFANSTAIAVSDTQGGSNVDIAEVRTAASPEVHRMILASANISISSTAGFRAGDFVYITDNDTGSFNVRELTQVTNSTSFVVSSKVSFASTNCAVGIIPGLESQYGAFKYANNGGIVRYTTTSDGVFDTFKAFATKIVLVSNSYHIVPRMADMRCLALQV